MIEVSQKVEDLSCFLEEFGEVEIEATKYDDLVKNTDNANSFVETEDTTDRITFKDFDGQIGTDVEFGTGLDEAGINFDSQMIFEEVNDVTSENELALTTTTEASPSNGFDQACLKASNALDSANATLAKVGTKIKIATNRALSTINSKKNLYNFQKGNLIISGDFVFLQFKNQLMLLKYKGNNSEVIVPDEVGGLPVTLIYDTAFRKGRFVITSKLKNFIGAMKSDDIALFTIDSLRYAIQGIHKIQLPVHLKYLPNYLFSHCTSLQAVEIPGEVTNIAPNAFKKCNVKHLAFSNYCTKNMMYVYLPDSVEIYIHNDVLESYKGVLI